MYKRIIALALIGIMSVGIFSGCGKKKIFEDKDAKWQLTALTDDELEEDTFYVKDTSSFYEPYALDGNIDDMATGSVQKGLLWISEGESLIPSMYSDGLLAYSTKATSLDPVDITRVKDIGWSLGIYGATVDINGYICFTANKNCIKGSNAYDVFNNAKSTEIRITSISKEATSKSNLGEGGTISGLEEGETYVIEYYAGSYFTTSKVTADYHFFSDYEDYTLTNIETTKNGYFSAYMISDAKSGYYYIPGQGVFKYYDTTKAEVADDVDMNEAYYNSLVDEIAANSQQYVVSITQDSEDVEFYAEYEYDESVEDKVRAILTAPNGEQYEMMATSGIITLDIQYAMAGRWTLNIAPQTLNILEVSASSTFVGDDATVDSYTVEWDEATSQIITLPYVGDGTIWGTITDSSGNLTNFEVDEKEKKLTATYTYMAADSYTINIYHYADTSVDFGELTIEDNTEGLETETTVQESD